MTSLQKMVLTKQYPELGTGPVSTNIYRDPIFFEKEIEAIFKRSWYLVGRVEQVAERGDFFRCELPTFRYSVLTTTRMVWSDGFSQCVSAPRKPGGTQVRRNNIGLQMQVSWLVL